MVTTLRDTEIADRLAHELWPMLALRPTASNPEGLRGVCEIVRQRLLLLGFEVTSHTTDGSPPVLVAHRTGKGPHHIGLAAHYDVEEMGDGWSVDPWAISLTSDRIFARGIADNLGPLWLRFQALDALCEDTPSLTFVVQGEEEVGSPFAHNLYPKLDLAPIDLWLEETGYFERDGNQRMLLRRCNPMTQSWINATIECARAHERAVYVHDRYLNKAFGENQCPFLTHLVGTAPYLAIGPNDPSSRIHQGDESLPLNTLSLSVEQFQCLLRTAANA